MKGEEYQGDGKKDELLPEKHDDPREGEKLYRNKVYPNKTIVRPAMRIICGPNTKRYPDSVKHDDVICVPNFFCDENDMSMYYKLVEEMRSL